VDPEGNAAPQVVFEPFKGFEDLFPRFLTVFNNNRTLEFVVDKEEYAGQRYFFKVVLKEEGLNAIGFSYYFQIEVASLNETANFPSGDDGRNETNAGD